MVNITEEAHVKEIRVFKQNQGFQHKEALQDKGLFVLRIKNTTKTVKPDVKINTEELKNDDIVGFDFTTMCYQETANDFVHNIVSKNDLFLPQTIEVLAEEISTYLQSRFRFITTIQKIMIVVEVENTRIVNYTRKNMDYLAMGTSRVIRDGDYCLSDSEEETDSSDEEDEDDEYDVNKDDYFIECEAMRKKPRWFIEVESKFEIKEFDNNIGLVRKNQSSCSICLEGFLKGMEVAKLQCSHIFHKDCMLKWLSKKGTCPMCRSNCLALV